MSRGTKWLLALTAVVVIVGGAGAGVYFSQRGGGPTPVQTATVERSQVVQTVHGTGRIQPVTKVNISADVSAKIINLPVKEGQWIERGTLLLELDGERYVAAVESAEASLRAAEANIRLAFENLKKTEKDFQRISSLYERKLESQAAMDESSAIAQVEKARHRASVDQAEQSRAALKQARDDLSKTRIFAPMSGTISQLNKEPGEIALGSQFQEDVIMVVSNLEGMEALVDVDENDIITVALGDQAHIEVDALPGEVLTGTVTEIANSAKVSGQGTTDQKTEFEVKVGIVDPHAKLRPGMTATSEIVTETLESVVAVPIQCVAVRTPEQILRKTDAPEAAQAEASPAPAVEYTADADGFVTIVWVVEDNKAQARQIETGIQSETHIEVTSGLDAGETIVVGNYRAISRDLWHGAPVQAQDESDGGQAGPGDDAES